MHTYIYTYIHVYVHIHTHNGECTRTERERERQSIEMAKIGSKLENEVKNKKVISRRRLMSYGHMKRT